jgi:hypothetical protein
MVSNLIQVLASVCIVLLTATIVTVSTSTTIKNANAVVQSSVCHPTLWKHVYTPQRLVPKDASLRAKYFLLRNQANVQPLLNPVRKQLLAQALQLKATCVTVRGTIYGEKAEADGDTHLVVILDKADLAKNYLAAGNKKVCSTHLGTSPCNLMVAEAICQNHIDPSIIRAKISCKTMTEKYLPAKKLWRVTKLGVPSTNSLLPPKFSHVCITGSNVIDTTHGWAEIHPISNLHKC